MLSLQAFSSSLLGLAKVLKAPASCIKFVIKQEITMFADALVYVVLGHENKFSDDILPNLFTEVFKALFLFLSIWQKNFL